MGKILKMEEIKRDSNQVVGVREKKLRETTGIRELGGVARWKPSVLETPWNL